MTCLNISQPENWQTTHEVEKFEKSARKTSEEKQNEHLKLKL